MRKVDSDTALASSTVGSGICIKGRIIGDGDLSIEGTVEGEIAIQGDLTIAPDATVNGAIEAASVTIEGTYEGDIVSAGIVRAGAGAVVRGTVSGDSFSVDEGAVVSADISADFELPEELRGGRR
ncbi:MAG: hypothetical protein CSA75_00065 [Sorangium cellulosum]|nr:MAG: hypothetical protein CSA75_00065 [Sorangium cellulosum]